MGIIFALLVTCVFDYFDLWTVLGFGFKGGSSYVPADYDIYHQSDFLHHKYLNPGTELVPKDAANAKKSE